jgi:CRP-like cAMP-binding protein
LPIFGNEILAYSLVNRLLSSLPTATLNRVNEHLQLVDLEEDEELFAPGEPISHVYFPETSVIYTCA